MLKNLGKSSLLLIDVQKNKVVQEAFTKGRMVRGSKRLPSFKELREVCNLVYDWPVDGPIMLAYFMMTAAVNTIRNHSYFISGYLMTLILHAALFNRDEMTFGVRYDQFFCCSPPLPWKGGLRSLDYCAEKEKMPSSQDNAITVHFSEL